jgi:hypothetical protein
MGYDLNGRGGYYFVNIDDWRPCLETAQTWGCKPAGTLLPYGPPEAEGDPGPDWKWNGSYLGNESQEVTDEDAKAFAAALDRAIEARAKAKRRRTIVVQGKVIPLSCGYDWRGYDDTDVLKGVADFARQGSFLIK